MVVWEVVSSEIEQVIEFFGSRRSKHRPPCPGPRESPLCRRPRRRTDYSQSDRGVRTTEQADKSSAEKVKALRVLELARILMAVPSEYRLLFLFLAQKGLRISEALALCWQDVDLEVRRIYVRRRLYKGRYAPPKSRFGERTVPIKQTMSKALRERWNEHPTSELVFAGVRGGPADRTFLFNRVLKPAARAVDLPWIGFHTFRHTAASMLFRKGWNAKQVQVVLGHHSPAFTLATYVHLLPDDLPDPDASVGNRATRPTANGLDRTLREATKRL